MNFIASDLTGELRDVANPRPPPWREVTWEFTVDVKGEILELKDTLNTMVDQLRSFASK